MSKRDPYIIRRINFRRIVVVTLISDPGVPDSLAFLWKVDLPITFSSRWQLSTNNTPHCILIDLIPLFVTALLHPMHRIMNKAIQDYEERVMDSQELAETQYRICPCPFRRGKPGTL